MDDTAVKAEMDASTYLSERVDDQLKYYEKQATRAKHLYNSMQTAIIFLGLLVPVIVNVPAIWETPALEFPIRLLVTVMSLTLALLNGLLNFQKYGDLWLSYRMTEELIKHEKFLFLTGAEPYKNKNTALPELAHNVEAILSAEHNKFRTLIEDAERPTTRQDDS